MSVFLPDWDLCNTNNFGQKYFDSVIGGPGTMNPCGRYTCTSDGQTNKCDCKSPFVAAENLDGLQTCVPGKHICLFCLLQAKPNPQRL